MSPIIVLLCENYVNHEDFVVASNTKHYSSRNFLRNITWKAKGKSLTDKKNGLPGGICTSQSD